MEVIIYHESYDMNESLDNFIDLLNGSQMKYFASDLLEEGLSYSEIKEATTRAIRVAKSSGIYVRQHFMPVYSQTSEGIMRDCKLSRLGYAMVLMNASPNLPVVGNWQVRVLTKFFE